MPGCITTFFISSSVDMHNLYLKLKIQRRILSPVKHLIQSFCKNSLQEKIGETDRRSIWWRELWIYDVWRLFIPNRSCLEVLVAGYFSGSFLSILFNLCLLPTILLHSQIRTRLMFYTTYMLNRILKLIYLYMFLNIYFKNYIGNIECSPVLTKWAFL